MSMSRRRTTRTPSHSASTVTPRTRAGKSKRMKISSPDNDLSEELHAEREPPTSVRKLGVRVQSSECADSSGVRLKEAKEKSSVADVRSVKAGRNETVIPSVYHSGQTLESDTSEDLTSSDEEFDGPDITAELHKTTGTMVESTEDVLDAYFTAHNKRGIHTSNRTMAGIVLTSTEGKGTIGMHSVTPFAQDQALLHSQYCKLFQQWLFQMAQGFNILLYGVGSKIEIVNKFLQQSLSESLCFTLDGYFPGLTIRQALKGIVNDVLEHEGATKTDSDLVSFITDALAKHSTAKLPAELFLIVHNIDGLMLQNRKAQNLLGNLACSRHIHVLATVDHINAPLLWDQVKSSQFNWIHHNVTSFVPYESETSYENSMLAKQSGALVLSSLLHVLKSLTPNSRGIFNLLAQYHMDHQENQGYTGLSFQELYSKCREQFLVNSDTTLRVQLTEFHDHKLVKSQKGPNGLEYLTIPIDRGTLQQYFATLE